MIHSANEIAYIQSESQPHMIVIKVGGGKDLNIDAIVSDIAALRAAGQELLLVHGGADPVLCLSPVEVRLNEVGPLLTTKCVAWWPCK